MPLFSQSPEHKTMLVLFGHAPNTAMTNRTGLVPAAGLNGGMPAIYVGTGMEFGRQGGVVHQHFMNGQAPIIDVSSKLGAPLKQTATSRHHSHQLPSNCPTPSPRRGQPMAYNTRYKTQRCHSYSETGYCNYKEKCQFAHGDDELRQVPRHPKRKTELCRNFHSTGLCNYGERCDFIHNEQPTPVASPQLQSSTLWQAGMVNNPLLTTSNWTSPASVGGSSSASIRRPATVVAPLTIPELIGPPSATYLFQPPSICGLSSVCSSDQSCTSGADSPTSSVCEQSPVSYSPDLAANGSTTSFDHYYHTPLQQQWPAAAFPNQMVSGAEDFLASRFRPTPDFGTAVAANRRPFTFSSDSTTSADGEESLTSTQYSDAFSPNPHQATDLDQLLANLIRLGNCRLGPSGESAGEWTADTIFGGGNEQPLIGGGGSMVGRSDPNSISVDRLPTFAQLTQGCR